jgi:hypothetical protein
MIVFADSHKTHTCSSAYVKISYTVLHTNQITHVESMDTNSFTSIRKVFHHVDLNKFYTYSVHFCGQLPYINVPKSKEKGKK